MAGAGPERCTYGLRQPPGRRGDAQAGQKQHIHSCLSHDSQYEVRIADNSEFSNRLDSVGQKKPDYVKRDWAGR